VQTGPAGWRRRRRRRRRRRGWWVGKARVGMMSHERGGVG
jgi:hypothetical protein